MKVVTDQSSLQLQRQRREGGGCEAAWSPSVASPIDMAEWAARLCTLLDAAVEDDRSGGST